MTRNSLDTYWLSKYVFGLRWNRIAIILSAALGKQNHDLVCGFFATVSLHSDMSYAAQKFHQSEVLEQILGAPLFPEQFAFFNTVTGVPSNRS